LIAEEKSVQGWESKKDPGTHPSRELSAYAGTYESPAYGTVKVQFASGKLTFQFHSGTSDLEHFQYDTFVADLEGKTRVTFCLDQNGDIANLRFHGIEFKRVVTATKP
jgi:hypothetical protein